MDALVLKRGVFWRIDGTLLFWGTENRLRHRPTQTKSKDNGAIFFCYLKSALVENAPLGGSTTHVHFAYYTKGRTAAHKHAKYKKCKDYSLKEYYCVGYINVYQN